MCYQIKAVKCLCAQTAPLNAGGVCQRGQDCGGTRGEMSLCVFQSQHEPVLGIYVNNKFGPELVDTIKEEELCAVNENGSVASFAGGNLHGFFMKTVHAALGIR